MSGGDMSGGWITHSPAFSAARSARIFSSASTAPGDNFATTRAPADGYHRLSVRAQRARPQPHRRNRDGRWTLVQGLSPQRSLARRRPSLFAREHRWPEAGPLGLQLLLAWPGGPQPPLSSLHRSKSQRGDRCGDLFRSRLWRLQDRHRPWLLSNAAGSRLLVLPPNR